jgi:glycosyltransferase involved in cell wall biosynthesis
VAAPLPPLNGSPHQRSTSASRLIPKGRNNLQAITLLDLPCPPPHQRGWPWTEQTKTSNTERRDQVKFPKISIVTPSYNQGEFIEQTIRSVLLQGYPNLEYIVIDGGSNDDTLAIIERYREFISIVISERDDGPATAINNGFRRSTGEWFNWINSDDYLLPGALFALASIWDAAPSARWVSGGQLNVDREGIILGSSLYWRSNATLVPLGIGPLAQDATFLHRSLVEGRPYLVDQRLKCLFDTTLYRDLMEVEMPLFTTAFFSAMRWYPEQITSSQRARISDEDAIYIRPYLSRLPIFQRVAYRLLQTRLHHVVKWLLYCAAHFGFLPRYRTANVCVFDKWSQRLIVRDARRCLLEEL